MLVILLMHEKATVCIAILDRYCTEATSRNAASLAWFNSISMLAFLPQFEPPTNIMTIFSSAFPAFKAYAERVAEGFGYAI